MKFFRKNLPQGIRAKDGSTSYLITRCSGLRICLAMNGHWFETQIPLRALSQRTSSVKFCQIKHVAVPPATTPQDSVQFVLHVSNAQLGQI